MFLDSIMLRNWTATVLICFFKSSLSLINLLSSYRTPVVVVIVSCDTILCKTAAWWICFSVLWAVLIFEHMTFFSDTYVLLSLTVVKFSFGLFDNGKHYKVFLLGIVRSSKTTRLKSEAFHCCTEIVSLLKRRWRMPQSCSVIVLIYLCLAVPHCWHPVYRQVLLERGVKHLVLMGCDNHIVIRLTINRKLCWWRNAEIYLIVSCTSPGFQFIRCCITMTSAVKSPSDNCRTIP